jgi:monoamine oxidase
MLLDSDVIVIGAGASGIAAAHHLTQNQKSVTLLEARNRIGGRIHTHHTPELSHPVELGAEFIHDRVPELWNLAKKQRRLVVELTESRVLFQNGRFESLLEFWKNVEKVLSELNPQSTQTSLEDYFERKAGKFPSEDIALTRLFLEEFEAASSLHISEQAIAQFDQQTLCPDRMATFRILTGYDSIFEALLEEFSQRGGKLLLHTPVHEIHWEKGKVRVHARSQHAGFEEECVFTTKKLISTLPLGIWQDQAKGVTPDFWNRPLPEKKSAALKLHNGKAFKIIFQFKKPIWEEKKKDLAFLFSPEEGFSFRSWWTEFPVHSQLFTAWAGGPSAEKMLHLSKNEIINRAIRDLARLFTPSEEKLREEIEHVYFHDWHQDPYSRGTYTTLMPGHVEALKEFAAPIESTLFFAGEATETEGVYSTVHGAFRSGVRAAHEALESESSFR